MTTLLLLLFTKGLAMSANYHIATIVDVTIALLEGSLGLGNNAFIQSFEII